MDAWLSSLPPWLYWLLLSPFIALGLGVFWSIMLESEMRGDSPWSGWHTFRKERGVLVATCLTILTLAAFGVILTAICALFFLPSLFYRFALGWSLDYSLPAGVFTTILIIVWLMREWG